MALQGRLVAAIFFVLIAGCATSGTQTSTPTASAPSPTTTAPRAESTKVPTAAAAVAESANQAGNQQVTCVHESDTRILQLQAHNSGCNLNYTKYGKTASVVKSANGTEACEKIEQRIRSKLESVGYSCK